MSPTLGFAAWWLEVGEPLASLAIGVSFGIVCGIAAIWWVRKVWS